MKEEKTFSEKFPYLKVKYCQILEGIDEGVFTGMVERLDIERHCLDKQRVREAIENLRDYAGGDKITCNMLFKELGLE